MRKFLAVLIAAAAKKLADIGSVPSQQQPCGSSIQHPGLRYDSRGVAHNPHRAARRRDIKAFGGIRQFKKMIRADKEAQMK